MHDKYLGVSARAGSYADHRDIELTADIRGEV